MPRPPAPGPAADKPPAFKGSVEAALARRLDADVRAPIALGLSGGGDSLALLLMAQHWAQRHGRRLLALTVDHRLNPDSARWTAEAGEAARKVGADWRALAWEGDKPATGLPAAARAARHRLLAETAREAGAQVILFGHTLDDVLEGERMREADAPGLGRLREWGPSPVWPEGRGVFLLRPMLEERRSALRDWLTALGQGWLDDPSNEDVRFARTRARRALNPPQSDLRPDSSPTKGTQDHPSSPLMGEGDPEGVEGAYSFTPDGRILIPRSALSGRPLSAALLCAGGGDTPPRGPRLARLIEQLAGNTPVTASLAGARISADAQTVEIGREAGERARGGLAPVALEMGGEAVWDGRFALVADVEGLAVGPLTGRINRLNRTDREWLTGLPPAARSALPVLDLQCGSAALPRPFGTGPAVARSLVEGRLRAACGEITRESPRPS